MLLTTNNNTASFWLQKLAGTGTRINYLMDNLVFPHTKLNSITPDRIAFRHINGWGQTTQRDMAKIFEQMYKNKIISPAVSERMMRCLGRNMWYIDEGISQIPPYIKVFSKNGCC